MSPKHIVSGGTGGRAVGNEPRQRPFVTSRTGVYRFGPFQLDAPERRLFRDGVQVPLRLKAFETLRMLVENAGHLVTKEELLRQVWSDAVVDNDCAICHGNDGSGKTQIGQNLCAVLAT